MIELPNLLFNLLIGGKFASFNELDIAYFNSSLMPIDKDKIAPLKATGYYKIYNNEITFQDNKNFDIYIKESKDIKVNKNIKDKKEDSLENIIFKLFYKLSLFYDLYNNINLFDDQISIIYS